MVVWELGRWRRLRTTVGAAVVVAGLVASIAASPGLAHADTISAAPPVGSVSADPDRFVPVTPARLREARAPLGPAPEAVPVLGRSGMPAAGVRAVALTVTARSAVPGAVTLWSGEGAPPAVPTLTTGPDRTATTTAIVPVGPGGRIGAVAAPVPADVTVDVTGWFPMSSTVVTDAPARLFDSGGATVDDRDARSGPVTAGAVRPLQVGGRGFGSAPAGSSVLLAVRTARAQSPSALTLWPSGAPQPVVPSAPVGPGSERSDLVYTAVGRDGQVDMALAEGTAGVVVDLVAVVPARSAVRALAPARVFDSRPGTVTTDGRDGAAGALAPGAVRRVPLGGRAGVPAAASAVLAHLTATAAPGAAPVELRAWSDAAAPAPPGPSVVAGPGETRGGLVVLPLAPDGTVALRADGAPSDVAVDVQGWIGEVPPPRAAAGLIWSSDFENGWSGWKDTPWNNQNASGPTIVTDPVRGGRGAAQFVLEGGGKRTEREPDVADFSEGDVRYFALSVFLAPGFPTNTDEFQVITQWKNQGTGSPPISVKVGKGQFLLDGGFNIGKAYQEPIAPAPTGRWVDLVVGITFSSDSGRSRVDTWVDGRQTMTDYHPPGGTLYGSSTSYLKTGIYRDESISQRGVLTMDDWRIGTSYEAVRR